MAILVFQDQAMADRVVAAIEITANIEGGAGPVKFGTLARLADGRRLAAYDFRSADLDWIEIYAGEEGLEIIP